MTFVWNLDAGGANAAAADGGGGGGTASGGRKTGAAAAAVAAAAAAASSSRRSTSRSPSPVPLPGSGFSRLLPSSRGAVPTTTSVHLAQWQSEQRARDEVLVRVKGQPRVKLNRVFEVRGVWGSMHGWGLEDSP